MEVETTRPASMAAIANHPAFSGRDVRRERVEAIRSTSPVSEPVCSLCVGTRWRRAGTEESAGFRRCECVKAGFAAGRLAERERMHPAIVRRLDDMCRVIRI